MFSNFASAPKSPKDEGASLSSVLETPALRVELALLILLCIDDMRSDLVATFDPDKTHDTTSPTANTPTPAPRTRAPAPDLISFDEPQHVTKTVLGSNRADRLQEVESTQLQALKRSACTFLDKWRAAVMHRICDVLSVRGETVRQAKAKRKHTLEQAEKQKQGISSLIDFDDVDPFASASPADNVSGKHGQYNVVQTKLSALGQQKRVLILHCLLLLLLSLEQYSAHSRVLLLRLTSSLKLETDLLGEHEKSVALGLLATAASQMDAEATAKKQASNDAVSRKWKVGLAAVGGAVLIGVTGGLAAPLLAAGLGTVMGGLGLGVVSTYLGALAGSSVLVGSLFGAYGAKMTGRLMEQYAKEVQDFEFIPIHDPDRPSIQRELDWADEQDAHDPAKRDQHRLRVCIGVSGWLSSPSDVNKPWEVMDATATESFALRFEMDAMLRLGNSLNDVLFSYAWDGVAYTVVSRTLLGALYAGLWPLGLIKAASVLDNPFNVALARADKAGKVLAHAFIDGVQGKRPVTLTGYSVGARVIYACLIELAEQHAFGLVESVVLMGTPAPADSKPWRQIRSVVVGRVVNVYSTEDYVLGFLYRSTKLQVGVAGLREVEDVYGIENADMSKLVSGHDQYRYRVGAILAKTGFGDLDFNKVAEQERALEGVERKKQQVKEQAKRQAHSKPTTPPVEARKERPTATTQGSSNTLISVSATKHESEKNVSLVRDEDILRSQNFAPAMYAMHSRQTPTNMSPSPVSPASNHESRTATPTPDLQKDSPTVKIPSPNTPTTSQHDHTTNAPKLGSAVAVTEILVEAGDDTETDDGRRTPDEDDDEDFDYGAEEVGSEFGELSMVDPVAMDDFDYGLM